MRALRAVILGLALAPALTAVAVEPPRHFMMHEPSKPLPEIRFKDGDGKSRTLADMQGKVVLLNIWATWCAPCRREMPTLDRLQARLGGDDFEVVALSIDRAGPGVVRRFFGELGIRNLALYIDATGAVVRDLTAVGLPTTLLIDREGRELGRVVGPAEWDTPEMVAYFESVIAQGPKNREKTK